MNCIYQSLILPPLMQSIAWTVIAVAAMVTTDAARSQDKPEKYALLFAIKDYEQPEMNVPKLTFTESDADAVGAKLAKSGYVVEYLKGSRASLKGILSKLGDLKRRGRGNGIIFVGLFGHGMQFSDTKISYFCPNDARVEVVLKKNGQPDRDERGNTKFVGVPETLLSIDTILAKLGGSPAAQRVLIADCCRFDSTSARGRSVGSNMSTADLPKKTAVLFACSEDEKAYESLAWGHGAFTKCLLNCLDRHSTMNAISAEMAATVKPLVDSQRLPSEPEQNPAFLMNTPLIDLQLTPLGDATRQKMFERPDAKPKMPELFSFADGRKSAAQAKTAQQAWAGYTGEEVDLTNSLGMQMRLLPPGEFLMGSDTNEEHHQSDEAQHRVQISQPLYVGAHEVTLGQFLKYYNADKVRHQTDAEKDGKGGWGVDGTTFEQKPSYVAWNTGWNSPVEQYMDHPVVNVSWNDAVGFCKWLSKKEGREYRLLKEAEWEYACRGGTTTSYQTGDDQNQLINVGNIADGTTKQKFSDWSWAIDATDGYVFTSSVGKFKANGFGLYDMHGNVWEWCLDGYDAEAYAGRRGVSQDPFVVAGSSRVMRGVA